MEKKQSRQILPEGLFEKYLSEGQSRQGKTGCHTLNMKKEAVKKCMNDTDITPPPVISTAAERSGEISLRNVASPWWQEISRLCVSLELKIFAPYRCIPPARDDDVGRQHTVISRGQITKNDAPRPVISTEAKRSGEISLRNVASPWWQEISRLCVSLEPKVFTTHIGVFLLSR